MTSSLLAGAATVVLVLVGAYLVAVETVVSRCNVVRALRLAEDHPGRGASALLWLTEHRPAALDTLLVLTTLVRLGLGAAAVVLGASLGGAGAAVAVVGLVAVVLLVGEVAPRVFALRHLEATGRRLGTSAQVLVRLVSPVAGGAVALGRSFVPGREGVTGPYASEDELRGLERDEEPGEALEPEERAMIRSIFELADTTVREIMQPRPDMLTVAEDAALDDVVTTVVERGYSRLPVHEPDDPDAVVGVVYAKDVLERLATAPERRGWHDLVRRPTFVPETKRVDDLLRELQEATVHLALVVDEYGELVGLVTIEDILEEIVGEIVDEHDHEDPLVEPLDEGAYRVDGRLGVDDLNELLGTELPEEGWDTVGGLVFATLGRVAVAGERVELDTTVLTVEHVQGRRVGKVLVERREPADLGGAEHDGEDEPEAHAGDEGAGGPSRRGPAATPGRGAAS